MSERTTNHRERIDPKKTPKSTPDIGTETPDPSRWHKTVQLSDGTPIGRLGAYWYILNEDGYAISDGYHEISCDETGAYNGTRSAQTEQIALYTEAEQTESE